MAEKLKAALFMGGLKEFIFGDLKKKKSTQFLLLLWNISLIVLT